MWKRRRWVTLGLRAELVEVTTVWNCHAKQPARVSKRYRLLSTHSWIEMRDKLLVQIINHLYVRSAERACTWTGNTEHTDFWSHCCGI